MYCPHCGTHNDDNNFRCIQCGQVIQQGGGGPAMQGGGGVYHEAEPVPNHLVPAIVSCVCFGCLPLGVAAVIFAAQVDSKRSAGDIDGAWESSNKAKKFMIASFAVGIPLNIVAFIVQIAAAGSGF